MSSRNMSKTQERVIKLISQPKSLRSNEEINLVLPWLKKKSDILMKIADTILKDIVRNCEFLKTDQNEVIIRQGDSGDCLYILLKGTVSVYINDKLDMDSDNDTEADSQTKPTKNWLDVANELVEDLHGRKKDTQKIDRKQIGKKIVTFGSGKVFGEIALLEECVRTASVLADEECHLLVIKKQLYNSTLKAYHQKDFKDKRDFINNNPLFMNWSKQHKRQLERGLIKDTYSPDMVILRQGDELRGLTFVREGIAKVLVEPEKHVTQYPHMSPFVTENDILELEHIKPVKSTVSSASSESRSSPVSRNHLTFENIHVKRKQGYVAAEKRLSNRSVILCTVRNGAMFGDIEIIQNLKTYCQSVQAMSYTEVYFISQRNVERLIYKKHPGTLKTLRDIVVWKMCNRATSVQGNIIPFVKHLVFKMTEERKPEPRVFPVINGSGSKLPDREAMFQNIIQEYLKNKAQLIEPIVPGAVYYKSVMRKRAKQRETVRRRIDGIKRQQLEKDMRSKLAAYTTQVQTHIDTALSIHSASDTDSDDETEDSNNIKVPAILTPKHLSQSDPVLSRPSSSRSRELTKAFMTEVDNMSEKNDKQHSVWGDGHTWAGERGTLDQEQYKSVYQNNHTICLVYDESLGKSKIVHCGPSEIRINDQLSQPKLLLDPQISEEDENGYDSGTNTPSDGELVGAPRHMISKTKQKTRSVSHQDQTGYCEQNVSTDDSKEDHCNISEYGDIQLLPGIGSTEEGSPPALSPRKHRASLPHISATANTMTGKSPNTLVPIYGQEVDDRGNNSSHLFTRSYTQRARTATQHRQPDNDVVTLPKVFSAGKTHTLVESSY